MEANVDYPVDCHITSSDMVIILANLLDNAIEACEKRYGNDQGGKSLPTGSGGCGR